MPRLTSFLSGKALLVMVAVGAATGGFTLGYFVGKDVAVPPSPSLKMQQSGDMPSAGLQNANLDATSEKPSSVIPAAGDQLTEKKEGSATVVSHEVSPAPVKLEEKKDIVKNRTDQEASRSELQEPDVPSKKKAAYTVQAASFKHQKDADALKQDLETKGYKAFVKKETNSKGRISFKVRVGEFERRNEASVAALKLNKTEGLNAFVTAKK